MRTSPALGQRTVPNKGKKASTGQPGLVSAPPELAMPNCPSRGPRRAAREVLGGTGMSSMQDDGEGGRRQNRDRLALSQPPPAEVARPLKPPLRHSMFIPDKFLLTRLPIAHAIPGQGAGSASGWGGGPADRTGLGQGWLCPRQRSGRPAQLMTTATLPFRNITAPVPHHPAAGLRCRSAACHGITSVAPCRCPRHPLHNCGTSRYSVSQPLL